MKLDVASRSVVANAHLPEQMDHRGPPMTNSEEPQLPVSPARRRQMLGKVIELHGMESTFVQN